MKPLYVEMVFLSQCNLKLVYVDMHFTQCSTGIFKVS